MKKILAAYFVCVFFLLFSKPILAYDENFSDPGALNGLGWTVNQNEGNIEVKDGFLFLGSNTFNRFPYLVLDLSSVFSESVYKLELSFKFEKIAVSQGAGIVFSDQAPLNGQVDSNTHKAIWLWPSPSSDVYFASNLCGGINVCQTNLLETIPNDGITDHKLTIERNGSTYKAYIDEGTRYELSSDRTFRYLWFGNPEVTNSSQVWPKFYIDYISTEASSSNVIGEFDLPFSYPNRPNASSLDFHNAFWNRLTAAFDHVFKPGIFRPFTGDSFGTSDCLYGVLGVNCYDSHNGTDFSTNSGQQIYSVADGNVVYSSEHDADTCGPDKGGFGCVVVVAYNNGTYGLFAHLDKITVNTGDVVNVTTQLGEMGETGCPGCGEHLHFGVLSPVPGSVSLAKKMNKASWRDVIFQIKPKGGNNAYHPACTYKAPNGAKFYFQDPSGWMGQGTDPWSISRDLGGCGTVSPYLWKYDVGTSN